MNLYDLFISKIRRIDNSRHVEIVETIPASGWREFALRTAAKGEFTIVLDEKGLLMDEINAINGLYIEVGNVRTGFIDVDYPGRTDDQDFNLEDFPIIGIGFKDSFAADKIEKQSMGIGLLLVDFFLDTSKTTEINKYILVHNQAVLEHWGLKSNLNIMEARHFKGVLLE